MEAPYFEDFVRHVRPILTAHLAKKAPFGEVEDVVQETLSAMWVKDVPAPCGPEQERGLLALTLRIADRRAADLWRTQARRRRTLETVIKVWPRHEDRRSALDEVLDRTQPAWLFELSPDAQDLLVRYARGMSVSQIAADLGVSANAVSSRLRRIRVRLRALLSRGSDAEESQITGDAPE